MIDGELEDSDGKIFKKGDFVTFEPGSIHNSFTKNGCLLIVFMNLSLMIFSILGSTLHLKLGLWIIIFFKSEPSKFFIALTVVSTSGSSGMNYLSKLLISIISFGSIVPAASASLRLARI